MRTYRGFGPRAQATPQTEPLPGREGMVQNDAGGYGWKLSPLDRLRRFLILGSEGGTYYVKERELTQRNIAALDECLADPEMAAQAVNLIAEVNDKGLAYRNSPALLALARAAGHKDVRVRCHALAVLHTVARTPTHLFEFLSYTQEYRGWGKGLRNAVANWYDTKSPDALAYQMVKYRQRGGWTHRDVLRKAHATGAHQPLYLWATHGVGAFSQERSFRKDGKRYPALSLSDLPDVVLAYEQVQATPTVAVAVKAITDYRLPWEALPSSVLKSPDVWSAILAAGMPMTAMIRNLGRMTACGAIAPWIVEEGTIIATLHDTEHLCRSRIHPMQVLVALLTYQAGKGARGSLTWTPSQRIVDALDDAFYASFENVEPSGKRMILAVDVSGSMRGPDLMDVPGLSPRVAAAAMAMTVARTEPDHQIMAFCDRFVPLNISPRQRLDDVLRITAALPFGKTDCALPISWSMQQKLRDVGAFVVLTDCETWSGNVHPTQALSAYRRHYGADTKLVVVGMTANEFTIADPTDPRALDVVGFDASTPRVVSDFAAGRI